MSGRLLAFTVWGAPKGRVHTQAAFNKRTGRVFTRSNASPEQKAWTAAIRAAAVEAAEAQGWEKREAGAVSLRITFIMPRPRAYHWKGPHAEPRHGKKPDLNNLVKALEDALSGILWRDDAQVAEGALRKRYAAPGEACAAHVTVRWLGEWYPQAAERAAKEV